MLNQQFFEHVVASFLGALVALYAFSALRESRGAAVRESLTLDEHSKQALQRLSQQESAGVNVPYGTRQTGFPAEVMY